MAITVVGFDGTVSEAQWARMMMRQVEVGARHGVWTGGDVSTAAGRAVTVPTIDGVMPGVWFVSDAPVVVAVAANGGNAARVDYIIAEADWTTNTVAFKAVTGSSGTPPALTQTAGTLWQMPLARVTVPSGVTTITSGNIEICKPLPRDAQAHVADMNAATLTAAGSNGQSFGPSVTIPDPGWPYRVDITVTIHARANGSGRRMRLEVVAGSSVLASGISHGLGDQQVPVHANSKPSRVFTGRTVVELRIYSHDANGFVEALRSSANNFDVRVTPA